MVVPKINSAHGSDTRNVINRAIDVLNQQGISIQDLVAEGQLTEEQYAELITVINGLIKSGDVDRMDLNPNLRTEVDKIQKKIDKGEVSVNDINKNKGKFDQTYLTQDLIDAITGAPGANILSEVAPGSVTADKIANGATTPEKTDFIEWENTENIFDSRYLLEDTGVRYGSGELYNINGYKVNEELLPMKPNTDYIKNETGHVAFYDASGSFISGISSPATSFTSPANTTFYRTAAADSVVDTLMVVEGSALPSAYVPFRKYSLRGDIEVSLEKNKSADPLYGLKWAALGDSTTNDTYGKPYHQHIKDRTGLNAINYGENGTTIAVRDGKTDSMLERHPSMDADADIITVMGGRNDISWAVTIGTMEDRVGNTLYGACHLLFSGLIEKYPGKMLGVILPLQRDSDSGANVTNRINAIKEVAEYYSLPILDMYNHAGLTPKITSIKDAYMPDGLHPNDAGHQIISRRIESWLRTL